MASPTIIDFEALLTPIPGDNPSGVDVRYTRYDIIKEARRADEDLPQGEWKPKGDIKSADWGKVIDVGSTVLAQESKDLQIAVWLTEALVKLHGYPGLRDGLRLIQELHARYWETMFPVLDVEDLEYRAAPIEWLTEMHKPPFFPFSIRRIPLLHSPDGITYALSDREESREVENLGRQNPKAKAEALAEGKISGEQFNKVEAATPLTHCLALVENVKECADVVKSLDQVLKEKFGETHPDRPSLKNIEEVLSLCQEYLEETIQKKGGARVDTPDQHASQDTPDANTSPAEPSVTRQVANGIDPIDRIDALRRLAAVAEYFRRTEPHSPVSYLVQRATKWGEMPLEEWLNEVIKSKDVLGTVRETLGLQNDKPKS